MRYDPPVLRAVVGCTGEPGVERHSARTGLESPGACGTGIPARQCLAHYGAMGIPEFCRHRGPCQDIPSPANITWGTNLFAPAEVAYSAGAPSPICVNGQPLPCKDPIARAAYQREYMKRYLADPTAREKHLARVKKNSAKNRDRHRDIVSEFRSSGCAICGEMEQCCLEAHHMDPDKKHFNIGNSAGFGYGIPKLRAELAKCICLCANCHAKLHAGVVSL